jgi:hypothetical protein
VSGCDEIELTLTSIEANTQYEWYRNEEIEPVYVGVSLLVNDQGSNQFWVRAIYEGTSCYSDPDIANVTVYENPNMPIIDQEQTCEQVSLWIVGAEANITYNWYKAGEGISLNTGNSFVVNTIGESDYYVEAVSDNAICSTISPFFPVKVTGYPVQPVIDQGAEVISCASQVISFSNPQENTLYRWMDVNTSEIVSTEASYLVTSLGATGYLVQAYFSEEECVVNSVPISVMIKEAPQKPVVSESIFCNVANLNLTNPYAGTTYNWFRVGEEEPLYIGTTLIIEEVSFGNYFLRATDDQTECSTDSDELTIQVWGYPEQPQILGEQSVQACGQYSLSLSAVQANVEYNWYRNGDAEPLGGGSTFMVSQLGSANYYVEASFEGTSCSESSLFVEVKIDKQPIQPLVNVEQSCEEAALLVINSEEQIQYTWFRAGEETSDHSGVSLITTVPGESTFFVRANNPEQTCEAISENVTFTIAGEIFKPVVDQSEYVVACEQQELQVANLQDGITYEWYRMADDELIGTALNVTVSTSGGYFVKASVSGTSCYSNSDLVSVEIYAYPSPPQIAGGGYISGCNEVTLVLVESEVNTLYNWYRVGNEEAVASSQTFTVVGPSSSEYYVEAVRQGSACNALSSTVTVEVAMLPMEPVISQGTSINTCGPLVLTLSNPQDTSYEWFMVDGGGNPESLGVKTNHPVDQPGNYTFFVRAGTVEGCKSSSAETYVRFYEQPVISPQGPVSTCASSYILETNSPDYDAYFWLLDGVSIDEAIGISHVAGTSGQYTVRASNQYCYRESDPVHLTLNVVPEKPVITKASGSYCAENIVLTSTEAAQYRWFRNGAEILDATSKNLAINNQIGNYLIEVRYNDDCIATSDVFAVVQQNCTEVDRAALVAIFNATNGPSWRNTANKWNTDRPIDTWFGVTVANGRVTGINLINNGLVGSLPEQTLELSELRSLNLRENNIVGIPDLSGLPLTTLDVRGNRLEFDVLLPNRNVQGFSYANQQRVGQPVTHRVTVGLSQNLNAVFKGEGNQYQWLKGGVAIVGANAITYNVASMDHTKAGTYVCEATNPLLPQLTLRSAEFIVQGQANIEGKVTNNLQHTINKGTVRLFRIRSSGAFDTTAIANLKTDGSYVFNNVLLGTYLVLVQADRSNFPDHLPTYFGDFISWSDAERITLTNSHFSDANIAIRTIPKPDLKGNSSISGYIEADLGQESRMARERRRVARAGVSVYRAKSASKGSQGLVYEFYLYTETDDKGEFKLEKLEKGSYKIQVEIPGIPMDESSDMYFTIGDEQVDIKVVARVEPDGIRIIQQEEESPNIPVDVEMVVFPNPATEGRLGILIPQSVDGEVWIRLIDAQGNVVFSQLYKVGKESLVAELNIYSLNSGLYMVHLYKPGEKKKNQMLKVVIDQKK